MSDSVASQLQNAVANQLAGDPMFNGTQSANNQPIPIIADVKGDIPTQIKTALSKLGVCVVILTPLFELFDNYLPSTAGWMRMAVDVFEDVLFNSNSTQIKADQICEQIVILMQRFLLGPAWPYNTRGEQSFFRIDNITFVDVGPPTHYTVNLRVNVMLTQPS